MLPPLKFKFDQLKLFEVDLRKTQKIIDLIFRRVARETWRPLQLELRPQVHKGRTGRVRRYFGYWFPRKRKGNKQQAKFGYKTTKQVDKRTAIAGNVLQHGSNVSAKKAAYLWIPLPSNSGANYEPIVTPAQVFANRRDYFVGRANSGSLMAFEKSEGAVRPLFLLRKNIHVAARPVQFESRVIQGVPKIGDGITETIRQVLEAKKKAEEITG